jgi:DNA-binding HxlR family transcriptional regulator
MPPTRTIAKSSVNRALAVVGDRWSQLIVQECFLGARRFEEFQERMGCARSTLSRRLQALVRHRVLEQKPHGANKARLGYHLAPRGRALFPNMLMSWRWGIRWGVLGRRTPTMLVHTGCGKAMLPEMRCAHCHGEVALRTCRYEDGPGAGVEAMPSHRLHRRRQPASDAPPQAAEVFDLVGERWTALVIGVQYFRVRRFDEIQASLGIATNILADRLRLLELNGVFERRLYDLAPPRYEYRLTTKGADLYPHSVSLLLWADAWLADRAGPPVILKHIACGATLDAEVVCSACGDVLTPENVSVRSPKVKTAA